MIRDVKRMTDAEIVRFIWKLPETCALDVIERGEALSLQEIADLLGGISRERVRQIVVKGKKLWVKKVLESSLEICDFCAESTNQAQVS